MPVSFMPGIPEQFFREFGLTVSVAVLFSLVVARLLTPLMAAYFLKPKPARTRAPLPKIYVSSLTWALNHRILASLLGLVIFVLSLVLAVVVVPKGLQPEGNPNWYQIDITTPPGSTITDTREALASAADLLKRQPETQHVFTAVGGGGGGGPNGVFSSGVTEAVAVAVLRPDRTDKVTQIRDRLRPGSLVLPCASPSRAAASAARPCRCRSPAIRARASTLQRSSCSARWPDCTPWPIRVRRPSRPRRQAVIGRGPAMPARLGVSAEDTIASVFVATVGGLSTTSQNIDIGDRLHSDRVRLSRCRRPPCS